MATGKTFWPWGFEVDYTPNEVFTNLLLLTLNLLEQVAPESGNVRPVGEDFRFVHSGSIRSDRLSSKL